MDPSDRDTSAEDTIVSGSTPHQANREQPLSSSSLSPCTRTAAASSPSPFFSLLPPRHPPPRAKPRQPVPVVTDQVEDEATTVASAGGGTDGSAANPDRTAIQDRERQDPKGSTRYGHIPVAAAGSFGNKSTIHNEYLPEAAQSKASNRTVIHGPNGQDPNQSTYHAGTPVPAAERSISSNKKNTIQNEYHREAAQPKATNQNSYKDPSSQIPKEPPQHAQGDARSTDADVVGADHNNSHDEKQHGNSENVVACNNTDAKQQPQNDPPRHNRKVSWGGKTIVIPQNYDDNIANSIPALLSEQVVGHYNSDETNKDSDSKKAVIAKAAIDLVSTIEAKMAHEGMDGFGTITTPRISDSTSGSAIKVEDLAKLHPIESEATYEIIKAIESHEQEQQQEDHGEEERHIEAIASVFSDTESKLLEHVPEGAEGLFTNKTRDSSHLSSVAGISTSTAMSESIISTANNTNAHIRHDGLSPPRHRSYSIGSAAESHADVEGANNPSSHGRTHTPANIDPTISSTMRSPARSHARRQPYEYRRKQHRRKETMEEKLFFLNQALDATNGSGHHEINKEKEDDKSFPTAHHRASTSLDLFNQNLARLFSGIDVSPATEQELLSEQETVPLTNNVVDTDAQVPIPPVDSGHFSSTSEDETLGKPVTKDASSRDMTLSQKEAVPFHHQAAASNEDANTLQKDSLPNEPDAKISKEKHPYETFYDDIESGTFRSNRISSGNTDKRKRSQLARFLRKIGLVRDIEFFLKPRTSSFVLYLQNLAWLMLFSAITAVVLFYGVGNPPIEYQRDRGQNRTCSYFPDPKKEDEDEIGASFSWWVLYLLVRMPITLTIAWSLEIFMIEFLILECRCVGSWMGSTITLLIVQAKGWPAILFFWSICNMLMLQGKSRFANHWGYWQPYIEVFNECNPSGTIVESSMNLKVQLLALALSIVVAVKRLLIGFQQGRKTFLNYAEELARLMKKILLISEVSNLAIQLELEKEDDDDLSDPDEDKIRDGNANLEGWAGRQARIAGIETAAEIIKQDIDKEEGVDDIDHDDLHVDSSIASRTNVTSNTDTTKHKLFVSNREKEFVKGFLLGQSQKRRIERLLGSWEEPERERILTESVSIGAILQFRQSLSKLDSKYPFSYSFGKANMRDHCVQSSQSLYLRLLRQSPDPVLHFNTLGLVALQRDGILDGEKLKSLIKLFRPDRDGRLSLIDFVKSVDNVYKEMKLLRASVRSSQKIDKSFEQIFNVVFYFVIILLILNALGFNALVVFGSLSSIILSFSFMISQASSKFVEGLLFIICRRPYDIGDYVTIQPVDQESSFNGSTHWIVRDIDLLTTTVMYSFTGEVATLSNGSIANSRVMNGARSLPAYLYVTLRFGVDTSFEKLEIFREAVARFVHKRPREWGKLMDIKNCDVSTDKGYIEYMVVLQHVNNWQQLGSLFTSRSHARTFCHELSKQLGIRYKSPSLPVDLNILGSSGVEAVLGEPRAGGLTAAGGPSLGVGERGQGPRPRPPNEGDRDRVSRLAAESEEIRALISDRRL